MKPNQSDYTFGIQNIIEVLESINSIDKVLIRKNIGTGMARMRWIAMFVAAVLTMTVLACSCSKSHKESHHYYREAEKLWKERDICKTDSLGKLYVEKGEMTGDSLLVARGCYYSSMYAVGLPDSVAQTKMEALQRAFGILRDGGDDELLSRVYNQIGVWDMAWRSAFYTAQYYFGRSIALADSLGVGHIGIPAEMNLSEICRIIGDTLGFVHDRHLLEYARRHNDDRMSFLAGFHCALYKTKTAGDTTELAEYIDAIRGHDEFPGVVDMVYARFFYDHSDFESARKHILKADTGKYLDFKILHGEIEQKLGNYEVSTQILRRALDMSSIESPLFDKKIHLAIARNLHMSGDDAAAWKEMEIYKKLRDEADSLAESDRLERYKVEYDVLKKECEIRERQLEISRLKIIITASALLLLVIIAGTSLYIRHRNRLYKDIVRQKMEATAAERELRARLASMESVGNKEDGNRLVVSESASGQAREARLSEIFASISNLTDREQIWRDKNLTREGLAEKIGCNRTYITEAIRQCTGMTYPRYMNACRVKEAVCRLSDSADDTSLKQLSEELGFLTISTFYSAFKLETGMSPANYRKAAMDLLNNKKF